LTLKNDDSQAQLEHQRLESLVNSMADGVIATDEKGAVALYNGLHWTY
jgi:signal transduction histidine kinase